MRNEIIVSYIKGKKKNIFIIAINFVLDDFESNVRKTHFDSNDAMLAIFYNS